MAALDLAALASRVDPAELDRALVAQGGFAAFVRRAWRVVYDTPLVWNWHMQLVCDHLEAAVPRREIRELVLNIPPATSKTSIASVMWPAYVWGPGREPWHTWMTLSFDPQLSRRDAVRCKELVSSAWYQARWGFKADPKALERWQLNPVAILGDKRSGAHSEKANSATEYYTTSNGMRFSTSFGGKGTGWHCHTQLADDPVKPRLIQAGGDEAREALAKVSETWSGTFASRKADSRLFVRCVMMQRLHHLDLAGVCLKQGYVHLRLPMEFQSHARCVTPWGADPRTQEGELLDPTRYPADVVAKMRTKEYSARDYAAQFQQDPTPDAGAMFQRAWFAKRWDVVPRGATTIISVDATFKDSAEADWVVLQVWARAGSSFLLLDQVRGKMGLLATTQAVVDLRRKWPHVTATLIEDKANGPGIIELLRGKVPGVIPINPQGGKVARANAVEPLWRAGDVLLPDAPWVSDFIEEHVSFPLGAHDDQVDAGTQALSYLVAGGAAMSKLAAAMGQLKL